MSAQSQAPSAGLFVRNATGLVRELSGFDAFNLVFSAILIPVGISQALGFDPAAFPGANLVISFLIAAVVMAAFGVVYLYLTMSMPRSGGDYVWVSRILHPGLGFIANATLTFVFLTWISFNFTTMLGYFGPAVFSVWGASGAFATWLSSQTAEIIISTILAGLFTLLMLFGTRRAAWYMRVMFWIVWIGMAVWLVGMAVTPTAGFLARFTGAAHLTPAGLAALAVQNGYRAPGAGTNWGLTLLAMIYAFQVYTGFQWTGYFAGEIRNVRRTAVTSILGSLLVSAILYMLGTWLVYKTAGYNFFSALVWLGYNHASALPAGITAVLPGLVRYLALPGVLRDYVGLAFLISILWWTPTGFLLGTRNLFSWAFDGLLPQSLADVDERFHSPVKAVLTIGIVVALLNVLNIYLGLSALLINIIAVMSVAFVIVALAGALFPYRRPDLWETAPAMVRTRIAGIPFITIAGVFSVAAWLFVLGVALFTPYFGLSVNFTAMAEAFAVPILAAIYYLIWSARQRSAGHDMSMLYHAIPPE